MDEQPKQPEGQERPRAQRRRSSWRRPRERAAESDGPAPAVDEGQPSVDAEGSDTSPELRPMISTDPQASAESGAPKNRSSARPRPRRARIPIASPPDATGDTTPPSLDSTGDDVPKLDDRVTDALRRRPRRSRPLRQSGQEATDSPPGPSGDEASEDASDNVADAPKVRSRPARDGRSRGPSLEKPQKAFMHPSEKEFAELLDYYHINYLYEPRSFPLRWDGNRVVEMFTPDFYLPEYDQYFELTTMKQSLVTQKNRKLRHVREMYPEVNVQLLYRRDLMRLMGKYGFGPLADVSVEGTERVLFTAEQVQQRISELGDQLTNDYRGEEPVLVGVLRGVIVFMGDLMRSMDLPLQIEFMEITHYGEERDEAIDVIRDVTTDLKGRHVVVLEDIVDTGLTLRYLLEYLQAKGPASLKVCTLLDKPVRRMADVPLEYIGFEVPDEFVIGYGLDYGGRYRNLPYIGVLQPIEPKAIPQR